MATHNKQTEGKETVEFFQDLDKDALKTEKFVEKNAKIIIVFFVVALLGVLGYFGYEQFIIKPKNEEALKLQRKNLTKVRKKMLLEENHL